MGTIGFDDLSKLIIDAIQEEQFFNKETLIPKVKAILKGFRANVASANYNKIEKPSESARRLRTLEIRQMEINFWKSVVIKTDPENIEKYFSELDALYIENGFTNQK
jgi:hypothetical protein